MTESATSDDAGLCCIFKGCSRADLPTSESRCPECGRETHPLTTRLAALSAVAVGERDAPLRLPRVVSSENVTTLASLPGFRVVRTLGAVSVLSGASGFTATTKGNTALERALRELREAAGRLGANAILGYSASSFGAGGGITSAFGGDAVGVLLTGTAALVEREERPGAPGSTP